MKNSSSRSGKMFTLGFLSLFLFNMWAGWNWYESKAENDAAKTGLQETMLLADQIKSLRESPERIHQEIREDDSYSEFIQKEAKNAQITQDHILSISPNALLRVEESDYYHQTINVKLDNITIPQAIQLCINLSRKLTGIEIPVIRLNSPEFNAKKEEIWNVTMDLTSFVYAPKIPPLSKTEPPISN